MKKRTLNHQQYFKSTTTVKTIQTILVANRGEIAVRIIRTARAMGIRTVAVYAREEGFPLHAETADEAWNLGKGPLADTYLNIDQIIRIARQSGSDAIHPGYGFLAENPKMAASCKQNSLIFIGPDEKAIRLMGNKLEAARFVKSIGVPLLSLKTGTPEELSRQVQPEEYPVIIKAAAGGGGKGMRIANHPRELGEILKSTSREAANYFGDGTVYVEKYIENPRHIEVQVLCDEQGNCIHLFERECSIQRRHQKIIEEAPSPSLDPETRQKMGETAVRIAHAARYTGAGTVEFLVDENKQFYFLEMNTRIQVEHPVTEMITGIDMVREQIHVAGGHPLPWSQNDISIQGHAIEARIYAEDPAQDFMPSPGKIEHFLAPTGNRIRIDTGVRSRDEISANYDPMVAKVIAHGDSRTEAAEQLRSTLNKTVITGIRNNLTYLSEILAHPQFLENKINTHFIPNSHDQLLDKISRQKTDTDPVPLLAGYIFHHSIPSKEDFSEPAWREIGYWRNYMKWNITLNETSYPCRFTRSGYSLHLSIAEQEPVSFRFSYTEDGGLRVEGSRNNRIIYFAHRAEETWMMSRGLTHRARHNSYLDTLANKRFMEQTIRHGGEINSPMFGKVLSIEVNEEMTVRKGQTLLVLEAMKMENNIQAPHDTRVKHIAVKEGEQVSDGQLLLETYNN